MSELAEQLRRTADAELKAAVVGYLEAQATLSIGRARAEVVRVSRLMERVLDRAEMA